MLGAAGSVARRLANVSPPRVLLPLLLAAPVAVAAPGELAAHVQCQVCGMAVEQARAHASEAGISDEDEHAREAVLPEGEGGALAADARHHQRGAAGPAGRACGGGVGAAGRVAGAAGPRPALVSPRGGGRRARRAAGAAAGGAAAAGGRVPWGVQGAAQGLRQGPEGEGGSSGRHAGAVEAGEMREIVCKKSCDGKRLPKLGEWVDEAFVPRNIQDLETEDLIAKMQMESPGISMTSYKKE
ncbi:unnamed protein product [Prorocentrum cordatum]|uniref:Selenoprotein F/M domain-containing protein n=1 Tax=Prorocentrum cordatum TaxID=2364126 RepID=A0ABN9TEH8_9DINO|nr:unnamed protein product [Polarella glacialis]